MRRELIGITLATLALAGTAQASVAGFRMYGAQARHWQWAKEAQQHVPLPGVRLVVTDGSAHFYPTVLNPGNAHDVLSLPFGWTELAQHGLFLHELGHAYDYADMTPARRAAFEQVAGTACAWRAKVCPSDRYGVAINVPPQEMFAETYAACALGLTQRGYQDAGFNTYGWVPPAGTDLQLCDLIRGT